MGMKSFRNLSSFAGLLLLHYHSRRLYFLLGYAQSQIEYLFFCGFGLLAQSGSRDYFTHRTVHCPTDIERSLTGWITMYYSPYIHSPHLITSFFGVEVKGGMWNVMKILVYYPLERIYSKHTFLCDHFWSSTVALLSFIIAMETRHPEKLVIEFFLK